MEAWEKVDMVSSCKNTNGVLQNNSTENVPSINYTFCKHLSSLFNVANARAQQHNMQHRWESLEYNSQDAFKTLIEAIVFD